MRAIAEFYMLQLTKMHEILSELLMLTASKYWCISLLQRKCTLMCALSLFEACLLQARRKTCIWRHSSDAAFWPFLQAVKSFVVLPDVI